MSNNPMDSTPRDPTAKEYVKLKKARKPLLCNFGIHKKLVEAIPGCTYKDGELYLCKGCGVGVLVKNYKENEIISIEEMDKVDRDYKKFKKEKE